MLLSSYVGPYLNDLVVTRICNFSGHSDIKMACIESQEKLVW